MKAYIIRRILIAIPLLLAMSFVTFLFIHLAPGNFFDSLRLNPQISEETILKYQAQYHLDKPVLVQYIYWLKNILRHQLNFQGVIFSDDLTMKGAGPMGNIIERTIKAKTAGCDMLLICNNRSAAIEVIQHEHT